MAALNLKSLAAYLGTAEASAALASTVVDAADAAADAGPLVVFYTNCQGRGLAYWLSKSPEFKRSYPRVRFIAVHDLVDRRAEDFTPAQKALLGACALVVYQPIGAKHGRFATTESGAWALLPQKAKRVGFAYLYDECCFPLYMTRGAVCARGAPVEQNGGPRDRQPVNDKVDAQDVAEVCVEVVQMQRPVGGGGWGDEREQEQRRGQPRPVAVARQLESEVQLGQQLRRGRQVARLGARAIARPSARWVVRARRAQRRVAHKHLRVGRRLRCWDIHLVQRVWVRRQGTRRRSVRVLVASGAQLGLV